MTKEQFRQCIKNAEFKRLFIDYLGWNNPPKSYDMDIELEGETYYFKEVARKGSHQVLVCPIEHRVTSSFCKRLDYKVRPMAENYICIFVLPNESYELHHVWAIPIRKTEKRDIVLTEYTTLEQTEMLYQKIGGITFPMTEQLTVVDVRDRVYAAFEVNSEKLTKDFYTGFQKEHKAFVDFISGIDDNVIAKDNKNKQWYASVMLNRLMFCYFIQKKGFLDGNKNYLREKLSWCQMMRGNDQFFSFYKSFLLRMFQGGLNSPKHDDDFENEFGRIPYLNGGMFDLHQLERDYADIDIKDEAFERLFAFFDKWEWHLDTRMTASGHDINPDVLGYIFEQYINDRAQMGAYYTKEDITEYIGKNCILPFLMDRVKEDEPAAFRADGYVWKTLRESGERYIYDAVKKGVDHWNDIPAEIADGIDTTKSNLLERRAHWNEKTPATWALPTEIWRESIERMQRCRDIQAKISNGEIHEINDFITYNLDIRQFVQDLLASPECTPQFLNHFNKHLLKVTILDPTCGSGAFLFAAMNILEPLYEICINRMKEFHEQNDKLFASELDELVSKYRSNVQYYIYKKIILHNLYGVDIMHEATEIAKLRLFLKMVAVVDVDMRADNLGLDPLPDIDFNIRCGNTLVGYATEEQLNKDLGFAKDIFEELANQELCENIKMEMEKVSMTFERFRQLQLNQNPEDMQSFKFAKKELNERLSTLNRLLNDKMYNTITDGTISYDKWEETHQPFHWLAEYYNIIHGNGGFDVIIGNPPYVEYTTRNCDYSITDFDTVDCGNLYAYVIERCNIISKSFFIGMIVPTSSISTPRMSTLQIILQSHGLYHSTYGFRPAKLFDGGTSANIHLSILLQTPLTDEVFSLHHIKWKAQFRPFLFPTLPSYTTNTRYLCQQYNKLIRSKSGIEKNILLKISGNRSIDNFFSNMGINVYYRTTGGLHYRAFTLFPTYSKKESAMTFSSNDYASEALTIYASNLWNMFYYSVANCLDVSKYEMVKFPADLEILRAKYGSEMLRLSAKLNKDIESNSEVIVRHYQNAGDVECYQVNMRLSKPIIDEIDKVLAKHYGFTEEELDFIINYDIKYRMGDELSDE